MTDAATTASPYAGITEGRIVHVRRGAGRCQPAIVVRHWSGGSVNLLVFRDGSNDSGLDSAGVEPTRWATSVQHESSTVAGNQSWHWPERAE
jgi:hypothetical protein